MSFELTSIGVALLGIIVTVITKQYFTTIKTLFRRIDENKDKIDMVKDNLNKHYHDKEEIREYIDLLQRPILQKMQHIDAQLCDLKSMLKAFIESSHHD